MKRRNKRTRDSSSDSSSDSTTTEISSESSSESEEESSEQEDAPEQSGSSSKNYEDAILARNGGKVKVRSVKYKYRREGDAPTNPNTNRGVIEAVDKKSRISIKKGVKADVKITNTKGKPSTTTNDDDETDGNTIPKEKRKSKKKKKKSPSAPPSQYDPTSHGFQTDDEPVRPEVIEIVNDFQAGKTTTNDIEKYVEELLAYSHKNKLTRLKDHCQMIMKSQLDSNTTDEVKLKYRTLAVKYKADDLRDFIKAMFGLT